MGSPGKRANFNKLRRAHQTAYGGWGGAHVNREDCYSVGFLERREIPPISATPSGPVVVGEVIDT